MTYNTSGNIPVKPEAIGPLAPNNVSAGIHPNPQSSIIPDILQTISVDIRSQPLRIIKTIISGSNSKIKEGMVTDLTVTSGGILDVICKPMMMNKIAEITAEITAYGNRVRTTSLISAS